MLISCQNNWPLKNNLENIVKYYIDTTARLYGEIIYIVKW